jgi:hypothetical protein
MPEVCGGGGAPRGQGVERPPWIAHGRPPLSPPFFSLQPSPPPSLGALASRRLQPWEGGGALSCEARRERQYPERP